MNDNSTTLVRYVWPYGMGVIFVNLFGLFGNGLILFTFSRTASFQRQTFGQIVGHLAANHLIFNLCSIGRGILVQFPSMAMSNSQCFFWTSPALLTYTSGNCLILCMGIDRFISISCPVWYKSMPKAYTWFNISFSWALGLTILLVAFFHRDSSIIVPSCSIGTALNGFSKDLWNRTSWTIFGIVILVYPLIYFQIWRQSRKIMTSMDNESKQNMIKTNFRLLNSFILIVLIYIGSGLLTQSIVVLIEHLSKNPSVIFYVECYSGILANFTSACDFYVLYARSAEYRQEFNKILVAFPCCKKYLKKNEGVSAMAVFHRRDRGTIPPVHGDDGFVP